MIRVLESEIPEFTIAVYVSRAGSLYEELPEEEGACHLLEHLIAGRILVYPWLSGNAITRKDYVLYYFSCPIDRMQDAISVLHKALTNAKFSTADIKKEMRIIKEEVAQKDTPDHDMPVMMVLGHTPYSLSRTFATVQEQPIAKVHAMLINMYKRLYRKMNIAISVPKPHHKSAKATIARLFAKQLAIIDPINIPCSFPRWQPLSKDAASRIHVSRTETGKQCTVCLINPVFAYGNEDLRFAAQFLVYMLNTHSLDFVNGAVREKLGLIYSQSAKVHSLQYAGYMTLSFSTTHVQKVRMVLGILLDILRKMGLKQMSSSKFKTYSESFKHALMIKEKSDTVSNVIYAAVDDGMLQPKDENSVMVMHRQRAYMKRLTPAAFASSCKVLLKEGQLLNLAVSLPSTMSKAEEDKLKHKLSIRISGK